MWRNTPHGLAFVPPQPADPMQPIQQLLERFIDDFMAKADALLAQEPRNA
jgi:hypothetical protein